jgi:hypothetical protein
MMKKISCEIIQIIERQSIDESIFLENTLSHKGFYDFKTNQFQSIDDIIELEGFEKEVYRYLSFSYQAKIQLSNEEIIIPLFLNPDGKTFTYKHNQEFYHLSQKILLKNNLEKKLISQKNSSYPKI